MMKTLAIIVISLMIGFVVGVLLMYFSFFPLHPCECDPFGCEEVAINKCYDMGMVRASTECMIR